MLKILIIDDLKMTVDIMLTILSKFNITDYAYNADEAIEKANKNDYDLFLIDINLGNPKDGYYLLKELNKMDKFKNSLKIAVTAYVYIDEEVDFIKQGFDDLLEKPFSSKELIDLVEKHSRNVLMR